MADQELNKILILLIVAFLTWLGREFYGFLSKLKRQTSLMGYMHGNLLLACNWTIETLIKNKNAKDKIDQYCEEDGFQPFIVNTGTMPFTLEFLRNELSFVNAKTMSELIKYLDLQEAVDQYNIDFRTEFFKSLTPERKKYILKSYNAIIGELAIQSLKAYVAVCDFTNTGFRVNLLSPEFHRTLRNNRVIYDEKLAIVNGLVEEMRKENDQAATLAAKKDQ